MQTSKLISTISYNTESFLTMTLQRLVKDKKLDYAMFIHHEAEEDEKKSHFHVVMKPCSKIDTVELREEFNEIDLEHPDLPPLAVMTIRTSKSFTDWYLYAIHHKGYLMSKGETRIHHYSIEDIWSSDEDLLNSFVDEMDISRYRCYEAVYEAFENNVPFYHLIADGVVPLGWIYQFKMLYESLWKEREDYFRRVTAQAKMKHAEYLILQTEKKQKEYTLRGGNNNHE